MSADLVVVNLGTEVADLRERLALAESYREMAQAALALLAERDAELEDLRRQYAHAIEQVRRFQAATT